MINRNAKIISFFVCFGLCLIVESSFGQNVVDKLKTHTQTNNFAEAIENSSLNSKLRSSGPFTLFVPSNEAFAQLTFNQKSSTNLLLNHVFTGFATERSLKVMSEVTCLSGQTVTLNVNSNQSLSVNTFSILESNIKADNGVIHIIDGVIK